MKKLLLLTFLFTGFLCEAQQKIALVEWQKTIGGSVDDELTCIKQTRDGGYILGGSSMSNISGEKTDTCRGYFDYWIIKMDVQGNIIWQKTIGGSGEDKLYEIEQTSDMGYVLFGYSNSSISGEKTDTCRGNSSSNDFWIIKLDSNGNIIWQKTIGGFGPEGAGPQAWSFNNGNIQETKDGGYIFAGTSASNISGEKTENNYTSPYYGPSQDYWILKLNSIGNIEWQKTIRAQYTDKLSDIQQTRDGGYIIGGYSDSDASGDKTEDSRGFYDYWIVKINGTGMIQWQRTIGAGQRVPAFSNTLTSIKQTYDGGYIVGGISDSPISGVKTDSSRGEYDYWVLKLDSVGHIVWQKTIGGLFSEGLSSIQLTNDGGYILSGYSESNISGEKTDVSRGGNDYWLVKINSVGIIEWQKTLGGSNIDVSYNLQQTTDGGYIVGGYSKSPISGDKTENCRGQFDYWIIKLKEIDAGIINGYVLKAENSNCFKEPNENGILGIIVKTEPKNFFGLSDTSGKYTILTDTGTYKVKQITPAILKPFLQQTSCPTSGYHTVSFSQYGQDTTEINFANYEKQCAYLQVELSQGRMRRCIDNNATIKYCNIGNVDTNNVQVVVQLPEYVTFVSASNPNYTVNGKKITFTIGSLRANECGTINLVTNVDCVEGIVGLTQCIKAWILPRNECVKKIQTDYNLWDKSEVTVDGSCTGTTVRFVIKNVGQNMADSSTYRIYKNAVQALSAKFKLTAGDSLVINISATGHTFRLEADQTLHYPTTSSPNATVENCNNTNIANRGFVNQQEQDKAEQDVEKVCLEIRDSYDPNDKQIFPSGVGVDKRIRHQVPLDFLIRFQNTGTDTAYKVVITDTLNQNLDLSTLEFGASSHPYKIEFTGSGRPILKFTFDKINLVDSFTNEPKSHGFVSFKITPYDSIPNGTIVKNSADIYFDFNLPIKTNTAQVSINDNLPTGATLNLVTSIKQYQTNYEAIYVYPNPFTQTTTFEFVYNSKATQLIIYDVNGELISQENITNITTYQLQRNTLSNGMYFYNIQNKDGEIIGRGKLVLQ